MKILITLLVLVAAASLYALSQMGPDPEHKMADACKKAGAGLEIAARLEPVCKTEDGHIMPIPAS